MNDVNKKLNKAQELSREIEKLIEQQRTILCSLIYNQKSESGGKDERDSNVRS